jgi:imidazolonepropionase-like amidohydrolase
MMVHSGLSNWEALKTATLNPALYLGRANEGVVREGAAANLLLLDADPLADIANTTRIAGVMLKGRWHDADELARMRAPKSEAATAAKSGLIYENAMVWTGKGFERRSLAFRGDRFVDPRELAADAVRIDASARFIVPAYANAHAHVTPANPAGSWSYVKDGVFYVWNPNTVVIGQADLDFYKRSDAYDVATAQGGITDPGGHPEDLYVNLLTKWVPAYKGMTQKDFLGNAFHYGRDKAEIDAALDLLVKQKADFVKAYLLNSERYRMHRDDPKFKDKGLNPLNFPYLVAAARARGLPVTTHVETVSDLKTAALAGAFSAAHMPGYWDLQTEEEFKARTLTSADASAVAKSGIKLVPTYALAAGSFAALAKSGKPDPQREKRVYALQASNLRLLKEAGAVFLAGTDTGGPIFQETEHLVRIGGLSTMQALQMVLHTGNLLFPQRRIGCFEAGCEADFLVLSADPSRDIANLRKIETRIMAGAELRAPEPAPK